MPSSPVITMRSGAMGTPVVDRASTRPRHKINLPLNKQGVEMRLPAIPVIRPSWRYLSACMVILLSAALIYMSYSPMFAVKTPQIKGLTRLSNADIEGALALNNSRIFMINPEQLSRQIYMAFPEIKNLAIEVDFPARVLITAVERQPVVTWRYQDMRVWIDNEGVLFPSSGDAETVLNISSDDAPPMVQPLYKPNLLIDGIEDDEPAEDPLKKLDPKLNQRFVDRNVLNAAILLYQRIPANTTILYNKDHGVGWIDNEGWNVYVGFDMNQLDEKLLVYQKMIERLKLTGISPKLISVEYVSAPYYRLE